MKDDQTKAAAARNDAALLNAAVFASGAEMAFLPDVLAGLGSDGRAIIVSDSAGFLREAKAVLRLSSAEFGLDREQITAEELRASLRLWSGEGVGAASLVVDMRWINKMVRGAGGINGWGRVAQELSERLGGAVISCYDRKFLVEDQLDAAVRAHRTFLAATGQYDNPYWLPAEVRRAPKSEQMSYLLGRIVPDYAQQGTFGHDDRFAARGADPDWLARPRGVAMVAPPEAVWQIYCFGQLRVYRDGNERIEWKIAGGAPKKTRTLFAYLLTKGETGAHAERLAELLWPTECNEDSKRSRLHHTIAMLRKTLGNREAVIRTGDYYRLNAPEGSWIDITSFEQLCRRGLSLQKRDQKEDALQIYRAAEQLYTGELFQDVPKDYVEDEQDDWCLPQRVWLREMGLKLQRNMSSLLREKGRLREALEHCQKALGVDPANDDANIEAMRIYHAQGRPDAVARQYKQYRKAMLSIDSTPEGSEVQALFLALTTR